jgi:hypothetical protein
MVTNRIVGGLGRWKTAAKRSERNNLEKEKIRGTCL